MFGIEKVGKMERVSPEDDMSKHVDRKCDESRPAFQRWRLLAIERLSDQVWVASV